MIRTLNMAPLVVARNKKWYLEPWIVEQGDPKFLLYFPSAKAVPGQDGDAEVIRDDQTPFNHKTESGEILKNLEDEILLPSCHDDVAVVEDKVWHVLRDMLNLQENQIKCED